MGFARSSLFAVGERRGAAGLAAGEDGKAIRTDVRIVESGIEAESRERSAVCKRCGRIARLCFLLVLDST